MKITRKQPLTTDGRRAVRRIWGLFLALVGLFLLSFILGRYDVPFLQVLRILINQALTPLQSLLNWLGSRLNFEAPSILPAQTWEKNMESIVVNVRLPRILLSCMVGCCLATAGASYQSVFHNPMAAPDILGASSGACFGAALSILLGLSKSSIVLIAFVCSLATVALVYLIASRTRSNIVISILLAGTMVSSLCSAGTSYIKLVADPNNQLPEITYWLMGSLANTRMSDIKFAVFPMLIGLIPLLLVRWRINLLTLGEEEARAMGVNTTRLRILVILCATFLTASSVAVSGMIGWVGLVIPHLCRKLLGNDNRYLIPGSMIFGAFFLLLVDNVSRNLATTEIPIGILTAFLGAPFFIYLMTRKEHSL